MTRKTYLWKTLIIGLLALLMASQVGTVSAGTNGWTSHSPNGGGNGKGINTSPAFTVANPPDDTFDGIVLDTYKWRIESVGNGTISQNDRLIATTSATSAYSTARVVSVWNFIGDFDVQADFQIGAGWGRPGYDHLDGVNFGAIINGQQYLISRLFRDYGSEVFLAWSSNGTPGAETPTTALSGKLRVARMGTTLSFLFDTGAGWETLTSMTVPSSPAQAYMGNGSINASQAFTTYIDNFYINSGQTNYVFRPIAPALLAPGDTQHLLNNRPTFDWNDPSGANGYTIQISKKPAFTALVGKYSIGLSAYTPKSDLPANMTLYWRVQSKGVNGTSVWSAVRSLTTANPPSIPSLAKPANNGLVTTYTPLLDWSDSKIPKNAPAFDHYRLQVATDAGFTSLVLDQNVPGIKSSFFTLTTSLSPLTKYYWRVSAYNTNGEYSVWSAVRIFRTN